MVRRCLPLFVLAMTLSAQDSAVKVREGKVTLPTYDEGAPNPNPQFDAFYNQPFPNYPYTIRTPVNKTRRLVEWRMVTIENEYLSCRVLPDLGGHLQGCTDRITGREIFYSNPAIRRDEANIRKSFISTGIESSFPFAHSRVASSPVDFAWSVRDGVGRVVVEDTDRTSGMTWRVEFILRPGSAVLEQRVTLYNGSPVRRGYHWWANAAVELDDPHLKIVYPVKWMLPHGDDPMTSWPISATGVDLSDIANHKTQLGLFAHGSREPWMAIYKPKFRSGIAHYADPDQVPGKKIWLWGPNDAYVKANLTENFNSYVEMQAGAFETQPEFAFLRPEETKTFTHYWIPFRDLGGIVRATRDAVLNLSRNGQSVLIELNATHAMPGAKLRVTDGAGNVTETPIDLDPKVKYTKTIDAAPAKVTVDVIDRTDRVAMHHVEGDYDSIPFDKTAKNPEPIEPLGATDSEAASVERGTYYEERDQWYAALQNYIEGDKKSPGSLPLRVAAGRTVFALNRYDDAARVLAGLEDPEASYYFGVAAASTSRQIAEAQAAFARAAKDPLWSAPARLQSALLTARESGQPGMAQAAAIIEVLAGAPGASPRIGALEVALLRRTGKAEDAKKLLELWLDRDPANDMLRVERAFLGTDDDASLWEHLGADPERLLNVAEQYRQMGAYDDALKLVDKKYPAVPATETEPGVTLPEENALVVYYRAYCRLKLGQDAKPDFATASTLSTLYQFPHREVYFRIFQAALLQNPSDAAAHALLGDLDFDSLKVDDAIVEWQKALGLKHDLPALYRNLGQALLDIRHDRKAAAPILLEGRKLAPNDQEIAAIIARFNAPAAAPNVSAYNNAAEQELAGVQAAGDDVASRALLGSLVNPDKAVALFTNTAFPKDKEPEKVRRAYIEVQLQRLLARAHSGKCSEAVAGLETVGDEDTNLPFTLYGFGAFIKSAHFQYDMGVIESTCGDEKAAKKRWAKISKNNEPIGSPDYVFPYLAANRMGDSDAKVRIEAALQALRKSAADDRSVFAQGALLKAEGKSAEGDTLLRQVLQSSDPYVQYLSAEALAQPAPK